MIEHFPVEFTLESGTRVIINKTTESAYDFVLMSHDKPKDRFTYVEDNRSKADWDEQLNFEELEALRKFWLMNEEVV